MVGSGGVMDFLGGALGAGRTLLAVGAVPEVTVPIMVGSMIASGASGGMMGWGIGQMLNGNF